MKSTLPKIEIGRVIDERKLSFLQIMVIVMGFLVVWLDGYHLQNMALVVPMLAEKWRLKPSDFQLVLSSALIGLTLASAFIASMGDRLGRRSVLVISMAVIGISSIGTGYASGMTQLVIWRFFTGLGLGASVPNAIALTSDYMPARRRALLVTVMFSGMTIGAFASGYIAPPIIAALGWRGVFTIGGAVPLVMTFLLAGTIPESLRLLIERVPDDPRIPRILARLAPDIDAQSVYARKQEIKRQSVMELFSRSYRKGTLLLWFCFLVNMFILYLLVLWLPTLLTAQGWSSFQAMRGTAMVQAGGLVGGLILSWYVDKGKTVVAMISSYAITAVAFGSFARLPSTGLSWWILLLVVGGGISGGQFVLNVLAASYYPPLIRATGVGWAYSIGRIGAVLSGFAGGLIVEKVEPRVVLELMVIPVLMCTAGVLMFRYVFQAAPEVASAGTASKQSATH